MKKKVLFLLVVGCFLFWCPMLDFIWRGARGAEFWLRFGFGFFPSWAVLHLLNEESNSFDG